MKTVILAGGKGTRLAEETGSRPKPMVEIGGKPILWHILHIYAHHGHQDFLIACGHKGEQIKEYFHNFPIHNSDFVVDLASGEKETLSAGRIDWRVGVVDTGEETMTGGRIARLGRYLNGERFLATYGDGLGNVDLDALVAFHEESGRLATVTAVRPPSRFGSLDIRDGKVHEFQEKPQSEAGWINGGFFVFEPEVLDYLEGDDCVLERTPLERLAADGQLSAFKHRGFWQPMDTLREKRLLERLWNEGRAPWKVWE